MLIYQIIISITVYAFSNLLDSETFCCLEPVHSNFGYPILAITLYELAPWIMTLIALWGIGRLFRRSDSSEVSDAENEQGWYEQQDNDYEEYDEEDDFVEDD